MESTNQPITLNVSGTLMQVNKDHLTKYEGSALQTMFSGRHPISMVDDHPLIERDPQVFKIILRFLDPNFTSSALEPIHLH